MTAPPYAPGTHLPGLHGLRGVAALAVLVNHVGLTREGSLSASAVAFTDLGAYGVHLFFVLSAFSLAHTYVRRSSLPGWIPAYLITRLFRIAPLFYVSLAISWPISTAFRDDWTFLLHVTFLFNLDPRIAFSVVPGGWAVGVEMLFYVFLPFLLAWSGTGRRTVGLLIAAAMISATARLVLPGSYGGISLPGNLVFFIAGLAAYRAFAQPLPPIRNWKQLTLLVSLPAAVAIWITTTSSLSVLFLAAPFAALCGWQSASPCRALRHPVTQWVGERSYSIYLLHPFLIAALDQAGWFDAVQTSSSPFNLIGYLALALAIVLPVAALSFSIIEAPIWNIGRRLARLIEQRAVRTPT